MVTNEVIQKIQLVEGQFTPSEAFDVLSDLIDVKINFHKLQRLSKCERNENADVFYPNDRIAELNEEKKIAKDFIRMARAQGYKLRINGILELELLENNQNIF